MLERVVCALLCSAVVAACGSAQEASDEAAATSAEATASTESDPCPIRGTELVSVVALPVGKRLSSAAVNVIELRKRWSFEIAVGNTGCATERDVQVRAVISAGEPGLAGKAQIDELFPGKPKGVVIGHFAMPPLDERLLLRVEVEPVPGEVNLDNNSGDYPVTFVVG